MDVRFVTPDLRRLDELKSEALALPFFEDERPLRGALGLVDWRLAGQLSRLLLASRATGAPGDAVLVPTRRRLAFDKLFLFGAGPSDAFDEKVFRRVSDHMFATLERAWVRSSVLALPGRSLERIAPARALELFIRVAGRHEGQDHVTLVETAEGARAMGPVIERERRRERAADLA
ncbi:MAG: M17 family peptidase N-terminal domain-containing protein [Sandaracinaceae bacterium]